jgi:HEAT repeat protein
VLDLNNALNRIMNWLQQHKPEYAESFLPGLKDNRAIAPLNKALHDDDIEVRAKALNSLFNFKVIDSLINALEDESEYIREQAVRDLGELKDLLAVEPLSRLLEDSAFMVREAAKKSLAQLSQ